MEKNKNDAEGGTREQGAGAARCVRHLPVAAALLIAATITLSSAMGGALAARPPDVELLKLQVFAKHAIHAARSDYEGPTAAGGDIDLSDFAIDGDLTSGTHISFQKGQVKGFMTSPDTRAVKVFSSGSGSVRQDAMELASVKLDLLGARLSALPQTSRFEVGTAANGNQEFRASVKRDLDVLDINGDRLVAAGNGETKLVLSGDRDGLLVIRVHGRSVHLRHVGFSVEGGLDPSHIVFFFPEASDLEICESGGARGGDGTTLNIPGSIIAPDASLTFAASTVTGQLFADSIMSVPGLPSGQVDRFPVSSTDQVSERQDSFVPSKLLQMVDQNRFADRHVAYSAKSERGNQVPAGCQLICARAEASSWSGLQRTQ